MPAFEIVNTLLVSCYFPNMQSFFPTNYLQGIDSKVVVEIFLEGGNEFTAIVLDVGSGFNSHPVALLPTEVL